MDYTKLRSLALEYKDLCNRMVFIEKTFQNARADLATMTDSVSEKAQELRVELEALELDWPALLDIDGVLHFVSPQKVEPAKILK